MRVFVAITLPERVQDALGDVQDALPFGRAVAPDNLHLTLAFLGEQPAALVADLHDRLVDLKAAPFEMQIDAIEVMGGRAPAVLVATVKPDPALRDLQRRVRTAAHLAGLTLGRARFRPHVTLARFARRIAPDDIDRLRRFLTVAGDLCLDPVAVDSFALVASTLRSDGPLYDELARYPLAMTATPGQRQQSDASG